MNKSKSVYGIPRQSATATPATLTTRGQRSCDRPSSSVKQLTVGVEEEFLLVDADGELSPSAPAVLDTAALGPFAQHEVTKFQVESCTSVCHTMEEVYTQLSSLRAHLASAARDHGLRLVASGTPLRGRATPPPLTDNERYRRMAKHFGALLYGHSICGCHVHIGMPDAEHAVHVSNHLRQWLPLLLALSVNSPFFEGRDTGHASWRTVIWSRWPSAGPPPLFESVADYESNVRTLLDSTAALDRGMLYWDLRLSSHLPTLELRVCDAAATAEDAVLVAALARGLALTALAELRRGHPAPRIPHAMLRAATWLAGRDGLEGEGVDMATGKVMSMRSVADRVVQQIRPALEETGDLALVAELLRQLRSCGTGAARQRRAFARRGQFADVIDLLATQTTGQQFVG